MDTFSLAGPQGSVMLTNSTYSTKREPAVHASSTRLSPWLSGFEATV